LVKVLQALLREQQLLLMVRHAGTAERCLQDKNQGMSACAAFKAKLHTAMQGRLFGVMHTMRLCTDIGGNGLMSIECVGDAWLSCVLLHCDMC
jgi:hypothetical protein